MQDEGWNVQIERESFPHFFDVVSDISLRAVSLK